jgi:hypothetical protein
LADWRIDQA